jgi:hypothetical protein
VHVQIDDELHDIAIETETMNVFELACATGQSKIAYYMLKDLNLVTSRDLNIRNGSKMVHKMMHLFVPILKKDI